MDGGGNACASFQPLSNSANVGRGRRVKGRREREAFSLYWQLFQPQMKTCSLCPTCLPACLPASLPAYLPACLPASSPVTAISLPFTPPVSLGIYGNLSVSTIFVVAWFRLARDSKLIDSFGCRTGWIHFLGIRSEHVTRRKTRWGGRVDKS